jgi:RNA polymerase sigma factor (sigma-70 family)
MKMFDIPKEERTLANYTKEAMCIIGRWGRGWMLEDNDVITNVVNAIIRAEHDFDPSRGCKRSTLRITYGRYQIIHEFRNIKKLEKIPHHFSIEAERFGKDGCVHKNNLGDIEDYREPFYPTAETNEHIAQQRSVVNKILKTKALTKLQRKYLKLRYLKGKSVNEMAEKFGCSKQAIHCVVSGGLKKLQKELAS